MSMPNVHARLTRLPSISTASRSPESPRSAGLLPHEPTRDMETPSWPSSASASDVPADAAIVDSSTSVIASDELCASLASPSASTTIASSETGAGSSATSNVELVTTVATGR
jgi:hypothetical protein